MEMKGGEGMRWRRSRSRQSSHEFLMLGGGGGEGVFIYNQTRDRLPSSLSPVRTRGDEREGTRWRRSRSRQSSHEFLMLGGEGVYLYTTKGGTGSLHPYL